MWLVVFFKGCNRFNVRTSVLGKEKVFLEVSKHKHDLLARLK